MTKRALPHGGTLFLMEYGRRSANAEWASDDVGVAFRKCGMGFRWRWSGVPQVRNGVPEASEWRSANAEWGSDGVGIAFRKCGMGTFSCFLAPFSRFPQKRFSDFGVPRAQP